MTTNATAPATGDTLVWFRVKPVLEHSGPRPDVLHVKRDDHALCSERFRMPAGPVNLTISATLDQVRAGAGSVVPCKRCVRKLT